MDIKYTCQEKQDTGTRQRWIVAAGFFSTVGFLYFYNGVRFGEIHDE